MKIELRYFTGTGNAWKVLDTCREVFADAGHQVNMSMIDPEEHKLDADLIGFSFPIYAFGMPRIVRRYLRSLKSFPKQQKAFFICTPAEVIGAANTTKVCERLLKRKNCKVVSSDVLNMPNNWIPFSKTGSPEINRELIDSAVNKATRIAEDILNDKSSLFDIKQIPYFLRFLGYFNFMFRFPGLISMKMLFNTYDTCNGCGICATACPTGSIKIVKGKPTWSNTCEQCMRCVHVCPQGSIYQFPSSTKGKDRYIEPDFKPLDIERKV